MTLLLFMGLRVKRVLSRGTYRSIFSCSLAGPPNKDTTQIVDATAAGHQCLVGGSVLPQTGSGLIFQTHTRVWRIKTLYDSHQQSWWRNLEGDWTNCSFIFSQPVRYFTTWYTRKKVRAPERRLTSDSCFLKLSNPWCITVFNKFQCI